MYARTAVLLVPLLLAITGCSQSSRDDGGASSPLAGVLCTDDMRAGLIVEVRDALTGLPAAFDASGEIRDGAYEETLLVEGGMVAPPGTALQMVGAWERPGMYEVSIRKPGYQPWSQPDVVVTADECHVQPVRLQAALEPGP